MLRVPRNVLMPAILLFCVVGSFAINNSQFDVGVMLAMGILGYILEVNGVPVAPVVLGLVLGPILEKNFMISMIKTDWDVIQFFSRPIAAILGVMTILTWLAPFIPAIVRGAWRECVTVVGRLVGSQEDDTPPRRCSSGRRCFFSRYQEASGPSSVRAASYAREADCPNRTKRTSAISGWALR